MYADVLQSRISRTGGRSEVAASDQWHSARQLAEDLIDKTKRAQAKTLLEERFKQPVREMAAILAHAVHLNKKLEKEKEEVWAKVHKTVNDRLDSIEKLLKQRHSSSSSSSSLLDKIPGGWLKGAAVIGGAMIGGQLLRDAIKEKTGKYPEEYIPGGTGRKIPKEKWDQEIEKYRKQRQGETESEKKPSRADATPTGSPSSNAKEVEGSTENGQTPSETSHSLMETLSGMKPKISEDVQKEDFSGVERSTTDFFKDMIKSMIDRMGISSLIESLKDKLYKLTANAPKSEGATNPYADLTGASYDVMGNPTGIPSAGVTPGGPQPGNGSSVTNGPDRIKLPDGSSVPSNMDPYQAAQRFKGMGFSDLSSWMRSSGGAANNGVWCADFMNAVLQSQGIKGTGSSMARSFLNWKGGVPTNDPQKGDVVVVTRGTNGTSGHVGMVDELVRDKNGNVTGVKIFGGNTGGRVGTGGTYPISRVLGFRKIKGAEPAQASPVSPPTSSPSTEGGADEPQDVENTDRKKKTKSTSTSADVSMFMPPVSSDSGFNVLPQPKEKSATAQAVAPTAPEPANATKPYGDRQQAPTQAADAQAPNPSQLAGIIDQTVQQAGSEMFAMLDELGTMFLRA